MIPPFSLLHFLYFISFTSFLYLSFFSPLGRASQGREPDFLAALLSRHKKIPVTFAAANCSVTGILFYISRLGIYTRESNPQAKLGQNQPFTRSIPACTSARTESQELIN
ncbi:Uncharacterised protein [Scardovia inopinata]|uniref:Uncharacterized protein n=1 Tax=Scardovia inopinata F0304 TaxID=641146 RepID=W1MXG0_SCAIO|nr:hypothetical protein HMPREF9020_01514 [Scardovia inopinata F0304]SUV52363.1 Uncharacterised protein [Scardovia inopinata]